MGDLMEWKAIKKFGIQVLASYILVLLINFFVFHFSNERMLQGSLISFPSIIITMALLQYFFPIKDNIWGKKVEE